MLLITSDPSHLPVQAASIFRISLHAKFNLPCCSAWTSRRCLRFLPLCPDAIPHACSLLSLSRSLSVVHSLPFWSSGSPSFHWHSQSRAAAAAGWRQRCSVTSGAAPQRDLVTSDRFKTSAPHLITFPEPLSFLCL